MRSGLAALTLLQVLIATPVQADAPARAPLLAQGRHRRLPPLVGRELAGPPLDFGQCVSAEEQRAVAPGQRWKAFRRSAVPFPPLLYLSQDRTFVEAMFLYWASTNVEERSKLRMLLPFFVWSCTPKNRTLVTPLFAHRDDADGRAGFIGPYYYRRDRHAQSDVLFPLFARLVDRDATTVVALNFYHHRTARGTHGAVVPLAFWGSYRDGGGYAVVPPLVWHFADRDATTTVVPPFYLKRQRRTGDWAAGLVPLWFGGREGSRYFHVVLPPLFAHWGDSRRLRFQLLNAYLRVDRDDRDWLFLLFPAAVAWGTRGKFGLISPPLTVLTSSADWLTVVPPFYAFRDRRSLYTGLVPLFFHGRRRGESSYTHVPPLLFFDVRDRRGAFTWALNSYYSRSYRGDGSVDPRSWDAGVVPLWFQGRDGARRYLAVPPLLLFDRENEATAERTTVFPLGFRVRDRRTSSLAVFPFFVSWQGGPESFWLAPPLLTARWRDAEGSATVVGPFYRRRTATARHLGLVPLFFTGRTATYRYTVVPLLPFWYQHEADRRLLVAGPFFHASSAAGHDTGFVPLLFTGRAGPRRYTHVPPLMVWDWSDAAAGTHTTIFPVGYRHVHPGGWHFGLIPLLFASAHGDEHRTVVPPLLTCHWGDHERERTIALGLIYSFRNPRSRHHGLFPLYLAGERDLGHPDGPMSYRLIAPPLYVHRWSPYSETTVLLQTWAHRARDGEWHGGSFPLYVGGRVPRTGLAYDLVLPPLFMRWETRAGRTLVVGPLVDRVTPTTRDTVIAPLFAHSRDRVRGTYHDVLFPLFGHWGDRERSRTVVLTGFYRRDRDGYDVGLAPLFFHGRHTDGRHHTHVAPLVWHWGTRDEENTAVVPFYCGGRDRARGTRYDVVFPFAAHWGDRERTTTQVLAGYYRRGRDGYDVGLAPLFFHGARTDGRHYTHVVPLVWHWGSRVDENTMVFPFVYSYRHRDEYFRAVTPFFYQWGGARVSRSLLVPLAYLEQEGRSSLFLSPLVVVHLDAVARQQRVVVFPFYWRFAGRGSDVNVAFPLWWDFHERRRGTRLTLLLPFGFRREARDETTTMFLNVVYTRGRGRFAAAWSFHLFPLFDLASYNPEHFKWQVLLGVLGRERQGRQSRWRIAYVWTDPS